MINMKKQKKSEKLIKNKKAVIMIEPCTYITPFSNLTITPDCTRKIIQKLTHNFDLVQAIGQLNVAVDSHALQSAIETFKAVYGIYDGFEDVEIIAKDNKAIVLHHGEMAILLAGKIQ